MKSEPPAEPAVVAKIKPPAEPKTKPAAPTETERVRKPAADRPRVQKAAGVKMHKGVPLLD